MYNKVVELYNSIGVRFGICVIGPPHCGKSTIVNILRSAIMSMMDQGPLGRNISFEFINPKSITIEKLYGNIDEHTQTWGDGIAS